MSPGARRATFWVPWLHAGAGARQIGHLGSLVARSHAVRQRRQNPCLQAAAAPGLGTLGHVMSLSQGPRQIEHSLCGIRLAARWIVAAASSCMANLPLAARWIVAAASSCMANLPTLPRSKPSTGVAWRGKIVLCTELGKMTNLAWFYFSATVLMSSPARPAAFVVARALEGISIYLLAGARARGVGVELRRAIYLFAYVPLGPAQ